MSIALGGSQINKAYLGGAEIQKMYLGSDLVFDNTAALQIPTGITLREVLPTGITPVISNFTIEDAQPTRIYFDSSELITATTFNGFTIKGIERTVTGITINTGSLTGHYLTMNAAVSFWEQAPKIMYDGSNDITSGDKSVYAFDLQRVTNNILEVSSQRARYVTDSGSGDGLTSGTPASLTYACANAVSGDIWWIQKGTYSGTYTIANDGLIDAPVKFVGYGDAINDNPTITFENDLTQSAAVMPLINGSFNTGANNYLIVKSLQVNGTGSNGFAGDGSEYTYYENCYAEGASISGVEFSSSSTQRQNHFISCYTKDNGITGIRITGYGSLVKDCYVATTDGSSQDYLYAFLGHNTLGSELSIFDSTIDCHANNLDAQHGYALKPNPGQPMQYCLMENCTSNNAISSLQLRHGEVSLNVIRDCVFDWAGLNGDSRTVEGCRINGAHDNIIDSCYFNAETHMYFYSTTENEVQYDTMGYNNTFKNCILEDKGNSTSFIMFRTTDGNDRSADNNEWINCTFKGDGVNSRMFAEIGFLGTNTGNKIRNSIIDGIPTKWTSSFNYGFTMDNTLFYDSFTAEGVGAITGIDPLLSASFQPQADFSTIDVPRIDGVYYGKNGNERQDPTTVGSVLSAEEVPGVVVPTITVSNTDGTADFSTIQAAIASGLVAGDVVGLKSGDIFVNDKLDLNSSGEAGNPITITSYGLGAKPIITTVAPVVNTWTNIGGNIWESVEDVTYAMRRLMIDGTERLGAAASQHSELGTSIPDLVEWSYNGTKLYIYSLDSPANHTISYASEYSGTYTSYISSQSYINFSNIDIQGGITAAMKIVGCNNFNFDNVDMGDMTKYGLVIDYINTDMCDSIIIENCNIDAKYVFDYSGAGTATGTSERGGQDGILAISLTNSEIRNNTFDDFGHVNIGLVVTDQSGGYRDVSNNKIYGNTLRGDNVPYGAAFEVDGYVHDNEIYNNQMIGIAENCLWNGFDNHYHDNTINGTTNSPLKSYLTGFGIALQSYVPVAPDVTGNTYENNLITNCESGALKVSGNNNAGNIVANIIQNNDFINNGTLNNGNEIYFQEDYSTGSNNGNSFLTNNIYNSAETLTIEYYETDIDVTQFNANSGDSHQHTITNNTAVTP